MFVRATVAGSLTAALMAVGCDKPPASQPAVPKLPAAQGAARTAVSESPAPVEKSPLLPEAENWTMTQALGRLSGPAGTEDPDAARLNDPQRVSAALRIVRLAKVAGPLAVDPLPVPIARRLRVGRVGEARWVIGVAERPSRLLSSPVFIDAEGLATPAAEGPDVDLARVYVSKDAEVFPHLLILPQRVSLVSDEIEPALVAKERHGAVFELRVRREYPYIALVCRDVLPLFEDPPDVDRTEVAVYRWDPDEPGFLGPEMDTMPDPCGGRFEMDLGESKLLIPVGGEVEEPEKPKPQPGQPDEPETPPM